MQKKIVFTGPESSGKTTLSRWAAEHFGGGWVAEFAREFLEKKNGYYSSNDLLKIAKGQLAAEKVAAQHHELLFCDTDLTVIWVWQQHKFGFVQPEIEQLLLDNLADFYFLMCPDLPWQPDPLREAPDPAERHLLFKKYELLLVQLNVPYAKICGDFLTRQSQLIEFLKGLAET